MQFWNKLPTRAKTELSLAACVLLLLALLSVYVYQMRQIDNAKAATQKISQRQKRAPKPVEAAAPADGPEALRTQLADVDASLQALQQRMDALNARLVPLQDPEALQRAQLAVSRAAATAGLQVTRFALRGTGAFQGGAAQPGAAATAPDPQKVLDNPLQRPQYDFTARTSYAGVMAFLGALQGLDFSAAPVQFAARVKTAQAEPAGARAAPPGQAPAKAHWLELELVLAL